MWAVSLALAFAASPECLVLRGDVITAADLATMAPEFGKLPPAAQIAWAPVPGVTRWIPPGELVRMGRQNGLEVTAVGVCLSRLVEKLDREKVLAAMHAAGAYDIELMSFGPSEAPPGRLEFSSRALPPVPRQASVPVVQWRGRLISEGGRVVPIWARARVSVRRPALVASVAIAAGQVIDANAFKQVDLVEYPGWETPLADPAMAAGRRTRRAIEANTPLVAQSLTVRREIERGDSVAVALPGEATLTAQAESPGRTGETILLRNPLTGRRFPSRVTGVGQAQMIAERMPKKKEPADDQP